MYHTVRTCISLVLILHGLQGQVLKARMNVPRNSEYVQRRAYKDSGFRSFRLEFRLEYGIGTGTPEFPEFRTGIRNEAGGLSDLYSRQVQPNRHLFVVVVKSAILR